MEFASKGTAGAGLGLGIAGAALGVLNGGLGNLLGGWVNQGWNNGGYICADNMPVNRYELNLQQTISEQGGRIALLEADKYTDQKLSEVYVALDRRIREMQENQTRINTEQAVYNGVNTAALNCMQGQIAQLYSLAKLVIPNTSVCPGWGEVTVTPAAATAATA